MAGKDEDQVSVGSYHSDAYTLPGDPFHDDVHSEASHDSYDSYCREEELASYRVPKEHGVSQPVYEAWIIYYSDAQDAIQKTTVCGLPVHTRYAETNPYVSCITEPHEQEDLSDMTLAAIHRYQATHKRSLPSRLIRGRAKSYEKDLDARIQKLPRPVQSELDGLLGDREAATGNRFRKRDWTVTVMREQYRFRFASAEYEEVKKSRLPWKNAAGRPSSYLFIIRGGDGKVTTDDKGMQTTTRHGNPWKRVDEAERIRMQSARDIRRFGKDHDANEWRRNTSRERSPSPPPRRVWLRGEGFQSSNPFTPIPNVGIFGQPLPAPHGAFTPAPPPPPGAHPHPFLPTMSRACSWVEGAGRHPPPPPPPMPMGAPRSFPNGANLNITAPPPPPFMPMGRPVLPAFHMLPPPPPPFTLRSQSQGLHPTGGADFVGPNGSWPCPAPVPPPMESSMFDDFTAANIIPFQPTGSSRASPPPAPRLSNLTTPTTFSPASSNRTGSSVDQTEPSIINNNSHSVAGAPYNLAVQGGVVGRRAVPNHALQDYQMQLMILEQQNKKRLMMARQEDSRDREGASQACFVINSNSCNVAGAPYNPAIPGSMVGPRAAGPPVNTNALRDYEMQLMLLEQQNKKRLMMARQAQDARDREGASQASSEDGPSRPSGPDDAKERVHQNMSLAQMVQHNEKLLLAIARQAQDGVDGETASRGPSEDGPSRPGSLDDSDGDCVGR